MKLARIGLATAVAVGAVSYASASSVAGSAPSNNGEWVVSKQRMYAAQGAQGLAEPVFVPANIPLVALPPQAKVMSLREQKRGGATKIGFNREIAETQDARKLTKLLNWERTPGGWVVAAITFESSAAKALRMGLTVEALPDEARVRFYAPGRADSAFLSGREIKQWILQSLAFGEDTEHARTFWAPTVDGDRAVVQIELPPGERPEDVVVGVPKLSHVFSGLLAGTEPLCGGDALCKPNNLAPTLRDATALLTFTDLYGSYTCTGTLLNPKYAGYKAPMILTANHCINTALAASTVQTTWFYRSASCGSTALDGRRQTLAGGARLLFTLSDFDASLLRLNAEPPSGAMRAGWSAALPSYLDVTLTDHHPRGERLQETSGMVLGNCSWDSNGDCLEANASDATHITILAETQNDAMGHGSSGSALGWVNLQEGGAASPLTTKVVGQLTGADPVFHCSVPDNGALYHFGRFDKAYEFGARRFLWLNSAQTKALDTNQDGKVDVVWSNPDTGLTYLWAMNGLGAASERFLFSTPVGWNLEVTGDFNGDGYPDYLWRNKSTALTWVYLMGANNAIVDQGALPAVGADFVPYVIGDTGQDGNADIVWRNIKSGAVYLWQMNGKSQPVQTYLNTVGLEWEIAANSASGGSLDFDDKADIFWRNKTTGQNWVYYMDGGTIRASASFKAVPDTNFHVVGIQDFDGDGYADILWRNEVTGAIYLWTHTNLLDLSSLSPVFDERYVGSVPSPWKIFKTGDLNADGAADIFWMNPVTGQSWVYLMNGQNILGSAASRWLGAASKGAWHMY